MCKCSNCGKKIVNVYFIDGKPYGIECFKKAITAKYEELSNKRLEQHILQCIATIEILKTKNLSRISNEWKLNFIKSVLNQWEECRRLSKKQIDIVWEWFNKEEKFQYNLYQLHLTEDEEYKKTLADRIFFSFFNLGEYKEKKHAEILKEILPIVYKDGYLIIEWEDSNIQEYKDINSLEAYENRQDNTFKDIKIIKTVKF